MPARRFPPGPGPLTALRGLRNMGSSHNLASVPAFFERMTAEYGTVVSWTLAGRRFYFLEEPALIEELLVTRGRDFIKGRGIQRLKRLLGEGLLTSEAPLHLRNRRMLQPAFHRERIAGYGATMVALTTAHLAGWRDGETRAIDRDMTDLTLDIAAQTLFGANMTDDRTTVHDALEQAMIAFPASMSPAGELLDLLPFLPVVRRFNQARAQLDGVVYGMIEARRRAPGGHDDLLAMLLAARDDDGSALDDEQIRDEAMTIFLAGHETTANALAWTLYLLARHPAVLARLRAELAEVLGDRTVPTAADASDLTYTADVFNEAMRLYPPAWILGRIAIRETRLGDWAIPKGAIAVASPLVTQRSARWFSDPLAFRPERRREEPAPPKFAFLPFGGGNRRCIGEPFALLEGVLVLATILRRFSVAPADEREVDIEPIVTLRPKEAIRLRLHDLGRT